MSSPVEEIKKRVDIVDLIGSYIRLSKAGANFKAVCPFHNEKTPSFYVSPAREIFHCFGCNAGGDVFRFVSMMEGVEFPEALEMLASRSGVVLKKEDPRLSSERKRLFGLMEDATKFYQDRLVENKPALEYLKGRGVTEDSIENFRIGFAPDGWENALNYLKQKGYREAEVEKVGLALISQRPESRSRYYDRFRSRIMFPVADPVGRIVGFSGRIFSAKGGSAGGGNNTESKYINSPQTILYDKSRVLYLWDKAKNDIRKENACIFVEGQMDALMSHQAGVRNVVATSGTALGIKHLELVKRLTNRLLLAFDTDEAGQMAARRGFELSLESGFDVNIIEVPKGKDPAETVKENPELWSRAVHNAKPVIAFFLENMKKKFSGDTFGLRNEAKTAVFPYIARLADEVHKAHWVQETSKVLGLKEDPIWDEVRKISLKKNPADTIRRDKPTVMVKSRRHLVEERIVGMRAWQKEKFKDLPDENLASMFSDENRSMLNTSGGRGDIISKLALEAELLYGEESDLDAVMNSLISELSLEAVKERLEFLSEEIRRVELAGEKSRLAELLSEFQTSSKKLNSLWQESRQKK